MKSLHRPRPLELPKLTEQEVSAIKAAYNAEPLALETIMKKLCGIGGISLDSDPIVMAAYEGKRIVATQLLYLINEPFDKIFKPKKEPKK